MDAQEVCLALNISKRTLQSYREYGIIPCSFIGGKYMYKKNIIAHAYAGMNKADNVRSYDLAGPSTMAIGDAEVLVVGTGLEYKF